MVDGITNLNIGKATGGGVSPGNSSGAGSPGGSSFSDVLKKSIDEVSRLQQDATQAVNDVMTGRSENLTGVMTAVEKADMAFKTLLAIRGKLMEAYEEIKNMPV